MHIWLLFTGHTVSERKCCKRDLQKISFENEVAVRSEFQG